MTSERFHHVPVLLDEVVKYLDPQPHRNYIDGTVGGGGHAEAILERTGPDGRLLGFDLDERALRAACIRLKRFGERYTLVKTNYQKIKTVIDEQSFIYPIHGILLDLGLSSDQLANSNQGFSFRDQGPVDMRFDADQTVSAQEILRHGSEADLVRILKEYGEEARARSIARAIVEQRRALEPDEPFTVPMLVSAVVPFFEKKTRRIHPATKTFQAIRLAVNQELPNLRAALPECLPLLTPGGRLAVISYHSLEDRIVKEFFRRESRDCICPPELPECRCQHRAGLRLLTRKPVAPTTAEIRANPRSRSAKLRVAEKLK